MKRFKISFIYLKASNADAFIYTDILNIVNEEFSVPHYDYEDHQYFLYGISKDSKAVKSFIKTRKSGKFVVKTVYVDNEEYYYNIINEIPEFELYFRPIVTKHLNSGKVIRGMVLIPATNIEMTYILKNKEAIVVDLLDNFMSPVWNFVNSDLFKIPYRKILHEVFQFEDMLCFLHPLDDNESPFSPVIFDDLEIFLEAFFLWIDKGEMYKCACTDTIEKMRCQKKRR